ncbi:Protein CBG25285 [Caenorhabditis briggsae]|uniref:Protein CBG25285 n=1 Tax=Caenorhabditis briggsae TaxID=6238 RepID=B6IF32_CAEBR|nr:Protein CBG25285 [Caenorhabditis briggsae]CAR98512.1 Protein CBG25285 [Caenorhabditis briggsae]
MTVSDKSSLKILKLHAHVLLVNDRIRKELKKLNYDSTTILHQLNYVIAQEADDIDR